MNNLFYNNKFTLILPEKVDIKLPSNFKLFFGNIENVSLDVKQYEIDNDQFFNGHLIVNNLDLILKIDFSVVKSLNINDKILYTTSFIDSHISSDCKVNDDILFCNSFVFWIISNYKRTKNNLYGDCFSHRIDFRKINFFNK